MNRIYNLVWSNTHGAFVVASEFARSQGKKSGLRQSRSKGRIHMKIRLFFTGLLLIPLSALALPTDGKVVAGQATIQAGDKGMAIHQSSDRAVIDWNSFNIGSKESVTFHQNSANSAVLNRVYDQSASSIQGKLSANGQVFIANPNGVIFGKGAEVNVGGLVATTKAIDPGEFMAGGKVTLSGDSAAAVINEGNIKAGEGGYVALVAARVSNTGTIEARKGKVALTAADKVDLAFDNGSLVNLQVSKGALDAEVKNGGVIRTPGGKVMLTATAANKLTSAVVNNTGVIEARTLGDLMGSIEVIADMDVGTAQIAGTLDASAPEGGNGGFIETSGAHVKVAAGTKITTKAPQGKSGTWLIDPVDFKIAPDFGDMTGQQLSDHLKDGNVVIQSTMGATEGSGDILVYDNVAWDHNTLTLDAINSVVVKATMTAGGDAGLNLKYKNEMIVAPGTGRIDFTGTGNTLAFNGTNVTIIRDINQLQNMAANPSGWYALGSDIDASVTRSWNGGKGFVGIRSFNGFFDGLGHVIDSLYMNDVSRTGLAVYGTGLFDTTLAGAKIRNVGVTNADITAYASYGGILVGDGQGDISYSFTTGNFLGLYGNCFGGLAGHNTDGQIYNSFSSATVSGPSWVGGLVGHVTGSASFYQSYATGHVIGNGRDNPYGNTNVGGLVGGLDSTAANPVRDSYSTVTISAPGYSGVGGLIGMLGAGSIINSYWDVDVTGINVSAGGKGLTSAQMRNPASFNGWDIDTQGGQATTWRMYEGKAAPMLKAFLRPAEAYMTSETFIYNGKSQAVDLLQWSGVDVDTSRLHYTTNVGDVTAKDVGTYDIFSYNFFSDPYGYDIIFRGPTVGQITINPADLTVKANDASKTYDGKAYGDSNGVTYTGLVNGETSGVLGGALAFDKGWNGAANAGSYIVNASGLASKNYNITYLPGTLTIDKAQLTLTARDAQKIYDGTTELPGHQVVWSGLVNGEQPHFATAGKLQYGGTSQGAKNAGSYTILLSGLTSDNYDIIYVPGTLTINKADLILGAFDVTKTYDGTLAANGQAIILGGQLFGDDSLFGGEFAFADKDAGGGKTVTVAGVAVNDGNGGGNYSVSYRNNTTSTIDKAKLSVTANDATKIYDKVAFVGGNGVTYAGFVAGEGVGNLDGAIAFGGDSQGAVNAGGYTISVSGLASKNYAFEYVDGNLTIDKALLVVTAGNDAKTYDGQAYRGDNGVTFAGFAGGDNAADLDGQLTWGGDGQGAVNAGDYTLSAGGLASDNYDISYVDGSLHVAKASLVLGSADVTKTYDGSRSANGQAVVLDGQLYRDDSLDGGEYVFTDENAGTGKTVTVGNIVVNDRNGGGNYSVSYRNNTTSTIEKAKLTVVARGDRKTYDGQAYYGGKGVTYAGLVNGETVDVLSGQLALGGTAQGAVNAGSYAISASGLTSGNYLISYVNGQLTVDKAALTVTANDASKTHDGQAYYGGNGVMYAGFVPGEGEGVLSGKLQWGGDSQGAVRVGEYLLLSGGLSSGNYTIAYEPAVLTIKQSLPYDNGGNDSQKPVTPETGEDNGGGNAGGGNVITPTVPEDGGAKIEDGSRADDIGDVTGGDPGRENSATDGSGSAGGNGDSGGSGGGDASSDSGESAACSRASTKDGNSALNRDCHIPSKGRGTMTNA